MKKRIITTLTLTAIILSATFTVNATPIDVTYDDIKIKFNFEEIQTDVEPFIYNGRTFLPIRPIVEAFGGYIEWNSEAKTVEILSIKFEDLKFLSDGLDIINDCIMTSKDINTVISNLTQHRNDLVANCWNNIDETLKDKINFLDNTSEYLEEEISTYLPILTLYPNTKAVKEDDIKNAFYYCQMAIHNVKLAYDELKKYNPNTDNSIILQDYAILRNKASTYISDATNIFRRCQNNFRDVIYSY